jgi:NAD-dependent DNA ligase
MQWFDQNEEEFNRLESIFVTKAPEPIGQQYKECVVVVTGSIFNGKSRREIENTLRQGGAKLTSNVSKQTTHVITGSSYTEHKKEKAEKLGIPVVTTIEDIK